MQIIIEDREMQTSKGKEPQCRQIQNLKNEDTKDQRILVTLKSGDLSKLRKTEPQIKHVEFHKTQSRRTNPSAKGNHN